MTEEQVTKLVADTLDWAARRADLPAIMDVEIAEGEPTVILFNTADGAPFSLKVEGI